jgi:WD40 repeat protein
MGKISIRSKDDFDKKIKTLKQATEWCEVIRYSPCGQYMAAGSHDNNIYVFKVADDYALVGTMKKHNSFVTSLDWSQDSQWIRSVCGAYEKLYFNVENMSFDSAGLTNTKDVVWLSGSSKLGWDVEGIYPSGEDGSHINGVDVTLDKTLVATGDDFGLVNLFRYPVCNLKH